MKESVTNLMFEARRRAGEGELAVLIEPLVGRLYKKQAVSSWALGRAMPPALVLLAACKVTGLSIDAEVYGPRALEERLKAVEKKLGLTTDD